MSQGDLTKIKETSLFRWWTTQDFWNQHQTDISDLFSWPEAFISQLRIDLGYDIPTTSLLNEKFDLVLDPDSHGAGTGTVFGPYGITIAAESVYNIADGVKGYWFYLLSLHETINVWTGHLTPGWPWADGSVIWHEWSQFPSMADIIITAELGRNDVSQIQDQMMKNDPGTQLLLYLQRTFGWRIYQGMFNLIRRYGVVLASYNEPVKTAIVILFLSSAAGSVLLPLFQQANVGVSTDVFQAVRAFFPDVQIASQTVLLVAGSIGVIVGIYLVWRAAHH